MKLSRTSIKKKDWKKYNNALVSRAELFLDSKLLKNWEKDLRRINKNKNGRKFVYPDTFIKAMALLSTYFRFTYRKAEELVKIFRMLLPSLRKPDHSTLHRRVLKMDLNLGETIRNKSNLVISIDSSGLKVHNRGEWIRTKHQLRRGFLKLHFAVNIKTNQVVEYDITDERTHDNKRFRPLVRRMMKKYKLRKVLADAAYDDHRNFNLLDKYNVKPGIKMKKISFNHKWHPKWDNKHRVRRRHASLMMKSFKEWRRRLGYKKRWTSEIVFSCFKNNFGECFTSKKMKNIEKEILRRVYVHNVLMNHIKK